MYRVLLHPFKLLVFASIFVSAACSSAGLANEQLTPTPLPINAASSNPTYAVSRGDISAQFQFTARVIPAVQEGLFFRADGRVRTVYVRPGDLVTAGQVLADLLQLDQLEVQKVKQAFDLRRAQISLEMVQLRQASFATQPPVGSPADDIQLKMQALEVELAQIALEETQLDNHDLDKAIADAQIIAPFDGKVLSVSTQAGNEVRAYNPIMILGDDSAVEIGATLAFAQMQTLSEGMPAVIELPSRPGERLAGMLRSLPYPYGTNGSADESQVSSNGSLSAADANTKIALTDLSQLESIRLGDLVNVTIIVESKTNVLWLPPAAIRTFGGRNFVVIQTEDLPRRVDIKVGIANEERVEIIEGLEEGQIVIAP